jgi:hypothetical protein
MIKGFNRRDRDREMKRDAMRATNIEKMERAAKVWKGSIHTWGTSERASEKGARARKEKVDGREGDTKRYRGALSHGETEGHGQSQLQR